MYTSNLIVTGLYRSGTTLLQRLLDAHPAISMPYQQLFNPLTELKCQFYQQQKLPKRYYVFDPCFPREEYTQAAFDEYLQLMDFPDVFSKLSHDVRTKEQAVYLGSRDPFCEEFIPALLNAKGKAIVIVRDIRDVIASTNFGKGNTYMGEILPTLYHIRMWRRSVAYALALDSCPSFHRVRYEDLVQRPLEALNSITRFLNITHLADHMIYQALHGAWQSNSSHEKKTAIDPHSVGKYRVLLSPETIAYIEATCFPELQALGYVVQKPRSTEKALTSFGEPFTIRRENFKQDYSMDSQHIHQEKKRIQLLLTGNADILEQERFFVLSGIYERLKNYV